MRTCSAVLCGVLAMVWLAPAQAEESGPYVGVETRSQRAELNVEKATLQIGGPPAVSFKANIEEAHGRNSIHAIRVGYIQEIGSDIFFDGSVALGSINPYLTAKDADPTNPGEYDIDSEGFLDSGFYFDISAGVRGIAGATSYTGGIRIEIPFDLEEDQDVVPGSGAGTLTLDQFCFAIEGTVGTAGDVRALVGVGINIYRAEVLYNDPNSPATVLDNVSIESEYEYDSPLAIFIARVSLLGEKFLSTWAGVAVKF